MNNHCPQQINRRKKNFNLYKTIQSFFFFLGLVLLIYLVHRMGVKTLFSNISKVGPLFLVICMLGGLWLFLQGTAWWLISRSACQPVPLLFFFRVKVISDAINTVFPSANLGGETVRAYLTRRYLSLKESLAGIMVDKTFELAGGILFMILGFGLTFICSNFPESLIIPAMLCLFIISAGIFLFIGFQLKGIYKILIRLTGFFPFVRRFIQSKQEQIQNLEQILQKLYRGSWQRTALAVGLHFGARIMGVIEALLVLRVLGLPVNFIDALFIMAMVAGINTIFFLMPGQWGISEGAHLFILQSMGFPPDIGLSLGIIKRIRKLFFTGLGLIFFLFQKAR